jgi:hypothetical protein
MGKEGGGGTTMMRGGEGWEGRVVKDNGTTANGVSCNGRATLIDFLPRCGGTPVHTPATQGGAALSTPPR